MSPRNTKLACREVSNLYLNYIVWLLSLATLILIKIEIIVS